MQDPSSLNSHCPKYLCQACGLHFYLTFQGRLSYLSNYAVNSERLEMFPLCFPKHEVYFDAYSNRYPLDIFSRSINKRVLITSLQKGLH